MEEESALLIYLSLSSKSKPCTELSAAGHIISEHHSKVLSISLKL